MRISGRKSVVGLMLLVGAVSGRAQMPLTTADRSAPAIAEAARQSAPGAAATGRIRGRVASADGGLVLGRAVVRATSPELAGGRSTVADDQGRYELSNLPAGRYTLTASKSGYLTLSFGQRRAREASRPIAIGSAERLDNIDFALPRGGVIVVHVTDDVGDPVSGARVTVHEYRFTAGQRRLTLVPGLPLAETNDQGEVRVHALPPGAYYVSAAPPPFFSNLPTGTGFSYATGFSFATTHYPGRLSVTEAQPVTLGTSQETHVSLPLLLTRVARVSGVVRRSDGGPVAGRLLIQVRETWGSSVAGGGALSADGSFMIQRLVPGDYVLDARPTGPVDGSEEFGTLPLTVTGDDISGLLLTTHKGAVLRGRVSFDTGDPPAGFSLGTMHVTANSLDPGNNPLPERFTWRGPWMFEVVGLEGKRVVRLSNAPPGWSLKVVRWDGKDVTETPLDFDSQTEVRDVEVVLTNRHPDVSGVVVDERGTPVGDCTVIFFPQDQSQWTSQGQLFGTTRPDQRGRFRITSLLAGRYLAAAVEYLELGAERDPGLLNRLRGSATQVMLGETEARTLSLSLATSR